MTAHRQLTAEVGDEVEGVTAAVRVEQFAGELANARLQLRDASRRERTAHQRAQKCVVRRILEEQPVRHQLHGHVEELEHRPVTGAEGLRREQTSEHVLIASERVERKVIVEVQRRFLSHS